MTAAATEETPEIAGQALKAIVTGLQSVAKGRQEVHTANDIQVHSDLQHCCMHDRIKVHVCLCHICIYHE